MHGCGSYCKSIRREAIEGEFEAFRLSLRFTIKLFNVAKAMFSDLWNYRLALQKSYSKLLELEIAKTERKIEQLLDRIVDAESKDVVKAREKSIGQLQLDQNVMKEKIAKCGRPLKDFDEGFRTAMDCISNPHQLWATGRMKDRHAVMKLMKLTFAARLAYVRGEGFQTPETILPFKAFSGSSGGENKMARPAGVEPATLGFGNQYSIHLSYGRIH